MECRLQQRCAIFPGGYQKSKEYFGIPQEKDLEYDYVLFDIDSGKANAYIQELEMYHVIDFENLGIYDNTNNNNVIDPTQFTSKDIYTGKLTDITEDTLLPEKYTENDRY